MLGPILSFSGYVLLELNYPHSRNIRTAQAWSIPDRAVRDLLIEFKALPDDHASQMLQL